MAELAATTFCFRPKRVPLAELLGEVPEQAPSPPAAGTAGPIPEGPCPVCPRRAAEFEPWRQAGSWKAQHARALQRQALLEHRIAELEAKLRLREPRRAGGTPRAGQGGPPPG